MATYKNLRLILGDQQNHNHTWYDTKDDNTLYVSMEMKQETDYVQHHIQKVVAFFLSMRSFIDTLNQKGHQTLYLKLDDQENKQDLSKNIKMLVKKYEIKKFEYQLPDEYRLDQQLKELCNELDIETEAYDTEHFLTTREEVGKFFEGKKSWLMENFYRRMREKHDILMDKDEPVGNKWNFDEENRKKLPKNHEPVEPKTYDHNVEEIVALLKKEGVETIGNIDPKNFIWPVTRRQGLEILKYFIEKCLVNFGTYQDAMHTDYWSIYHARISFLLNSKMLSPLEVVNKIVEHWKEHKDEIKLQQVEGFVRQIIGWREFMRGIYWAKMPGYASENYFGMRRKLPDWYWTGDTKMNCLKHAVSQSLDYAYAHHIQRLMVTGNFALLVDVHPDKVDEWYLGIYIDAIQWVEITNTRGMSQFADGGVVGTKPYISSANYMNKMSNYCSNCHYSHSKKTGDNACPFNSLYWRFMHVHRDRLKKLHRMSMMYSTWDKKDSQAQQEVLDQAEKYLEEVDNL